MFESKPDETTNNTLPRLLTACEVARALGIGHSTAYRLMQIGTLPSIRIGRCVRVSLDSLREFITANAVNVREN
jgi:excisionase family DNA binding protein